MSELTIEQIDDVRSFAALEGEWWALWNRSAAATPFQTPAWLLPWWDAFAPGPLCAVAIRLGGTLVGLAPLYGESGRRGPRLLPIGISLSDYLDVLIDIDVPGVGAAMMKCMGALDRHWECELAELAPDASALRLPVPPGWAATDEPVSACPVLTLPASVDDVRRTHSAGQRQSLRTARN